MAETSTNAEALTLEETNKVRESLGLAPIGAETADDVPDEDDIAEANFAERRAAEKKKKEEQDLKEKIDRWVPSSFWVLVSSDRFYACSGSVRRGEAGRVDGVYRARNRSALNAKLKGSTLGDQSADDGLSAKAWLKKQKKRAKDNERALAERRAREMEEADKLASYDERDLAGLKVGHVADDFEAGEDVILTLKDSRVLAGEGEFRRETRCGMQADPASEDELQNVNLVDDAAIKAAKERKRKAQAQYTGFDDDEFDEDRVGKKADILGKYDDEFSTGKVRTEVSSPTSVLSNATKSSQGFRLGAATESKAMVQDEDEEMVVMGSAPATKVKLSLDYTKDFETGDYLKEGEVGFKKPKKKKVKRSTRKAEADGDGDDAMEVDPAQATFNRRVIGDGPQNLVDDDDLQAALARSRREAAKRKPRVKPEDIAAQSEFVCYRHGAKWLYADSPAVAQIKQEEAEAPQEDDRDGQDDGRITFDGTSEFARNVTLESVARPIKRERADSPPAAGPSAAAVGSTSSSGIAGERPVVVKIERLEPGEEGEVAESSRPQGEDEDMSDDDEDEGLAELAAREGLSLAEYRQKIDAQMRELDQLQGSADGAEGGEKGEQPAVVGNGLAGVLSMLRNQGTLKKQTAEEAERERVQKQHDLWLADWRRRQAQMELDRIKSRGGNKDQAQREWENKMREQNEARQALDAYKNYKPDINIVYHDEFGREMTPKEAWKSLSHKFQSVFLFSCIVQNSR